MPQSLMAKSSPDDKVLEDTAADMSAPYSSYAGFIPKDNALTSETPASFPHPDSTLNEDVAWDTAGDASPLPPSADSFLDDNTLAGDQSALFSYPYSRSSEDVFGDPAGDAVAPASHAASTLDYVALQGAAGDKAEPSSYEVSIPEDNAPKGINSDKSALSPYTISGGGTPITKLPNELLCDALKYLKRKDTKAARLVCRGFNDCAWPAFGAGLAKTVFDLRSQRSWDNLVKISEKKELAPYVKALRFGCGYVPENYPGVQLALWDDEDRMLPQEYLSSKTLDWIKNVKKRHNIAYTNVWPAEVYEPDEWLYWDHLDEWDNSDGSEEWNDSEESDGSNEPTEVGEFDELDEITEVTRPSATQLAVKTLTSALSCFNSLYAVAFDQIFVPATYRKVEKMLEKKRNILYKHTTTHSQQRYRMDSVAIGILLQSLSDRHVTARDLSVPVRVHSQLSFHRPSSVETMRDVLMKLERLQVLNLIPWNPVIHLGSEQVPYLTHLRVERWVLGGLSRADTAALAPLPNYLRLKQLEVCDIFGGAETLLHDFIRTIRGSLEVLNLTYETNQYPRKDKSWAYELVMLLQHEDIYLKMLRLRMLCSGGHDIPKQALDAVACQVDLSPLHWRALENQWARDGASDEAAVGG
jgi:hypothetical protein